MSVTLSNLTVSRVSAGSSAVVPPSGDPYWSSVSLLTETTSVNNQNNNAFLDSSINAYAVTTSGTVAQGYYSPFSSGGGSMYFDGTAGNYLSTSSAVSTSMNPSDFTAEAWVYTELVNSVSHPILGNFGAGSDNNYWGLTLGGSNKFVFQIRDNTSQALMSSTTTPSVNTWYHVAVTRTKSTNECKLYINGVLEATATINKTITARGTFIGASLYTGLEGYWKGYISNVAVTTSLKYTGNFTPSTTPLTAVTGTQLLLSATNAGIYDATAKNNLSTTGVNGGAYVTTTQKKFGTSSIELNGSGALMLPGSSQFTFGTGNFTIECWFRGGLNVIPEGYLYAQNGSISPYIRTVAGQLIYGVNGNFGDKITVGGVLTFNVWYHVAVSRSGTSTKLFLNGTQIGSTYTVSDNFAAPTKVALGSTTTPTNRFYGYVQDMRVTKGVARYTANFTAPTAPFPTN